MAVAGEEATVFHLQYAVGVNEIAIVVRDGDDSMAIRFDLREEGGVKEPAEDRILVSGPLVKDINWAVVELGKNQRKTLFLAGREVCVSETLILHVGLAHEFHTGDEFPHLHLIKVWDAEDPLEDVEIGEDRGEQIPIGGEAVGGHGTPVPFDLAGHGLVEGGQQLEKSGFAAAVAAYDEDDLARFDRKIERGQSEGIGAVTRRGRVGKAKSFAAERFKGLLVESLLFGENFYIVLTLFQVLFEVVNIIDGAAGAGERGDGDDDVADRTGGEEHDRDHGDDDGNIRGVDIRQEEQDARYGEEEETLPDQDRLIHGPAGLGAQRGGGGDHIPEVRVEEIGALRTAQLELLVAVEEPIKVFKKIVFEAAGRRELSIYGLAFADVDQNRRGDEHEGDGERVNGEEADVDDNEQEHARGGSGVDNRPRGNRERQRVGREDGVDPAPVHLLENHQIGRADGAHDTHADVADDALDDAGRAIEHILLGNPKCDETDGKQEELADLQLARFEAFRGLYSKADGEAVDDA